VNRKYKLARWIGHRYWLRGRGRLVSLLCPPNGRTGEEFEVDFFAHRYRGRLDDFIDRHVYLNGGWEMHILALMSQLARVSREVTQRPVAYVDVGANTGQHVLFMSRHAESAICFEPFEPVRRRLEQRLADNDLHNVKVMPIALSAQAGIQLYYPPQGDNQGTGSLISDFSALVANRPDPIEVRTDLGDDCAALQSSPRMTILKIDVEGGERRVLEGLRKTLHRCRPAIVIELSQYTRDDIGSLDRLYTLLYPDAVVFTVEQTAWRRGYNLRKCDFSAPSDILVLPSELVAKVPRSASFAIARAGSEQPTEHSGFGHQGSKPIANANVSR